MPRTAVHRARSLLALLVVALLAAPAGVALATEGMGTRFTTIQDRDRDERLEYNSGEGSTVRANLGVAQAGRVDRRVPRLSFGQFSDSHIVDEESPLRFEYLDVFGPPLTSAYRPQEAMSTQVQNQMVQAMRTVRSPITGGSVELVMTTGDNTDSTQYNETRWMVDLLDGGRHIDPDSGDPSLACPGSGQLYDGVRGDNNYYEPDSSTPGSSSVDGPGYSPSQSENELEAGRSNRVRDYPGLFEVANRPFRAVGLRRTDGSRIPWYGTFGNHDALIAGNGSRNAVQDMIATGCVKVESVTPFGAQALRTEIDGASPQQNGAPESLPGLAVAVEQARLALDDPAAFNAAGGSASVVPPDPDRRLLRKREYIEQHFQTGGLPVGHGFTRCPEPVLTGPVTPEQGCQGNFVVKPKPGVRFLVLDTVNDNGGANGNVDDPQFRWIHQQLLEAEAAGEVVFAFAHHSLRTQNQPFLSPFPRTPGDDNGGDFNPAVHFGESSTGGSSRTACTQTSRTAEPAPDETLRCLFLRHPGLVSFVVGHEHVNRIQSNSRPGTATAVGGFYEITTASHTDFPQQSRVIDLVDNRDGTLSIFTTMLDHASAPNPGTAALAMDTFTTGSNVARLASISRELSYNDPDADNGEDGSMNARGVRADRNTELVIDNPYPLP